jgi:hypothetical protein
MLVKMRRAAIRGEAVSRRRSACVLLTRALRAISAAITTPAWGQGLRGESPYDSDARFRGLSWALGYGFIPAFPPPALLGFAAIARDDLNPEGAGQRLAYGVSGLSDSSGSPIEG